MKARDWEAGVRAGENTVSIKHVPPWWEVRKNGVCEVPVSNRTVAETRAAALVVILTPENRAPCAACGRIVGMNQYGALFGHAPEEYAPGKPTQPTCPGSGLKPGHRVCTACCGAGEICSTCLRPSTAGCNCPGRELAACAGCSGEGEQEVEHG